MTSMYKRAWIHGFSHINNCQSYLFYLGLFIELYTTSDAQNRKVDYRLDMEQTWLYMIWLTCVYVSHESEINRDEQHAKLGIVDERKTKHSTTKTYCGNNVYSTYIRTSL